VALEKGSNIKDRNILAIPQGTRTPVFAVRRILSCLHSYASSSRHAVQRTSTRFADVAASVAAEGDQNNGRCGHAVLQRCEATSDKEVEATGCRVPCNCALRISSGCRRPCPISLRSGLHLPSSARPRRPGRVSPTHNCRSGTVQLNSVTASPVTLLFSSAPRYAGGK
jgi:hypothetical protein